MTNKDVANTNKLLKNCISHIGGLLIPIPIQLLNPFFIKQNKKFTI